MAHLNIFLLFDKENVRDIWSYNMNELGNRKNHIELMGREWDRAWIKFLEVTWIKILESVNLE